MSLFNPIARKIAKFFLCAALAAAVLAPQAARADRRDLRIGMSQYPSTLHPYYDSMVAKSLVLGAALRPVTAYGPDWQPACLLCTELPSLENGRAKRETRKDGGAGIAATYTLRDGLFWGDGTPVTTRDIVFAWQAARHPQAGASNAEFFAKDIVAITARDDKTFTIHFDKEKCDFAAIGDFVPLPAHLEQPVFEQDPATYMNRTLYNTAPGTPGLYLGPYVVEKAEPGARILLRRNPHWTGPPPAFDTVAFRAIENSPALAAGLLSGDIDYIAGELGLLLDQAVAFERRLEARRPGQYKVVYKPGLAYEHIDLPLHRPPFDDVRVRRALMHAMNRDAINEALFGGRQPVAASNVNPLDSVFTGDVPVYAHDPARAAALLDEAGWKPGPDGLRYNEKGEKLSFTLATTAGNATRETVAQAIQSDWRKAGIDVAIETLPARVLFGEVMRKRAFAGGVMYAWMSAPRNIPRTTLHSSLIPSAANGYAGQNYPGYASADMDGIIDSLETACAPAQGLALWRRLQQLYARDLPALPLYYRADSFFMPAWLEGVEPTGHLHPTTLWIEDWSVAP